MVRLAVTSDLHFDASRELTPPEMVRRVAEEIAAQRPDAVVLAGDLGHPFANFEACLEVFEGLGAPVGVVAGNHDVWRDEAHSSQELWERALPEAVRERGFAWLEQDTLRVGPVAIVGSTAWYDYSAADPSLDQSEEFFVKAKADLSNDGYWIDWLHSDVEFARELRLGLVTRIAELEADGSVERVVVATHVPLLEGQIPRQPGDYLWSVASAFFGNLRTGEEIARFPKVTHVVSGHAHMALRAVATRRGMPDLKALVVGSDYGAPQWLVLEL